MNTLMFGLSVTAVGLIIVFLGLALLIWCITLLRKISTEGREAPSGAVPGVESAQDPNLPAVLGTAVALAMEQQAQEQLIAVLTAAVSALWEGDGGFVVRRVRRIQPSSAWEKAGREEQIYSRM